MLFGYSRVSTKDQNLELQNDALEKYGCERIFSDFSSGAKTRRPDFDNMKSHLRSGDTVVIWRLDRIGRSLKHLISLVEEFNEENIGLISLNDPIDTTTAQGRFTFNIFASLAQFERELIRERTLAGLAAARARGRQGGRRPGLSEDGEQKARLAESLYNDGIATRVICDRLNMSRSTLYKYLRYRGVEIGK